MSKKAMDDAIPVVGKQLESPRFSGTVEWIICSNISLPTSGCSSPGHQIMDSLSIKPAEAMTDLAMGLPSVSDVSFKFPSPPSVPRALR